MMPLHYVCSGRGERCGIRADNFHTALLNAGRHCERCLGPLAPDAEITRLKNNCLTGLPSAYVAAAAASRDSGAAKWLARWADNQTFRGSTPRSAIDARATTPLTHADARARLTLWRLSAPWRHLKT